MREILGKILEREDVRAVLAPFALPTGKGVMPALVADTERLAAVEPFSPAFPLNGAKLLSRLSREEAGGKTAALVRPCELRAFVELEKLHQGSRDELILVGMDCPGAVANRVFSNAAAAGENRAPGLSFTLESLKGEASPAGLEPAPACRICEHVTPEGADISIGLFGLDITQQLWALASTDLGKDILAGLGLSEADEPPSRQPALKSFVEKRVHNRDGVFAETRKSVENLKGLASYLSGCINCYNCRVACPVCYCRECVFTTDVFEHQPRQYLNWADRKGAVKMPTDTVFYHLTRMAHMSLSCVGCGQCSNACPNDIPLVELFRTVSHVTQAGFQYEAGRDPQEAPPLSLFKDDELSEVVGL